MAQLTSSVNEKILEVIGESRHVCYQMRRHGTPQQVEAWLSLAKQHSAWTTDRQSDEESRSGRQLNAVVPRMSVVLTQRSWMKKCRGEEKTEHLGMFNQNRFYVEINGGDPITTY